MSNAQRQVFDAAADDPDVVWLHDARDLRPAGRSVEGWRPPTPAPRGPAIVCVHGYRGECAHYAPDTPEWRHPRAWLAHVRGPFVLEAVADWSAQATGKPVARWDPDSGAELREVVAPASVAITTPDGAVEATHVGDHDGRPVYAVAPVRWRAMVRAAVERLRGGR